MIDADVTGRVAEFSNLQGVRSLILASRSTLSIDMRLSFKQVSRDFNSLDFKSTFLKKRRDACLKSKNRS